MAVAIQSASPQRLTYDQYMAEGETNFRYEILDGVRIVTNPTRRLPLLIGKRSPRSTAGLHFPVDKDQRITRAAPWMV